MRESERERTILQAKGYNNGGWGAWEPPGATEFDEMLS